MKISENHDDIWKTLNFLAILMLKTPKNSTKICWNIEVWAVQKHANLVDLVKSFPTNIFLQNLASIQKRTNPMKFAHLAEKPEKSSISNLSTKVSRRAIPCRPSWTMTTERLFSGRKSDRAFYFPSRVQESCSGSTSAPSDQCSKV